MSKNYTGKSNWAVTYRWSKQIPAPRIGMRWQSSNGNFRFEGLLLYSYRTPIARILPGKGVALLSNVSYSVTTTGKHIRPAYSHARLAGLKIFMVPDIMTDNHEDNLRALIETYRGAVQRLIKRRVDLDIPSYLFNQLTNGMSQMVDFQHTFHLSRIRLPDLQNDMKRIEEARQRKQARYNSPKEVERRVYRKAKEQLKELVFGDEA